jgi:hypothetical protein
MATCPHGCENGRILPLPAARVSLDSVDAGRVVRDPSGSGDPDGCLSDDSTRPGSRISKMRWKVTCSGRAERRLRELGRAAFAIFRGIATAPVPSGFTERCGRTRSKG